MPLLGTKALDELPPRVLRFRLRLMRYQFNIVHVPGKNLITADALSRAPADVSSVADSALQQEVDAFMVAVTDGLPATDQQLQEILTVQQDDLICMTIEATAPSGGFLKIVFRWHSNLMASPQRLQSLSRRPPSVWPADRYPSCPSSTSA